MSGGDDMAKMTDRHKYLVYVLHKEFEYKQTDIAQLMQISQSTVANAYKEVCYRITIQNLENELQEARELLSAQGLKPKSPIVYLENDSTSTIKIY